MARNILVENVTDRPLEPSREGQPRTSSGRKRKFPYGAAALWAVVVFLLINFGLSFATGHRLKGKPEDGGATISACDSAVRQFSETKETPSVVLIGSSVLMAPLWSADVRRFSAVPDVYHHHRCLELERMLEKRGLGRQQVFTFALPGLMISDGYLLADKLLRGDKKPRLLVYGLAPRDFMDDLLTGETRTVVFQRLMDLSDLPRLGDLYLSTPKEKMDFIFNNVVYLYGKRWRYQDKMTHLWKRTFGRILPQTAGADEGDGAQVEQQFLLGQNRKLVWAKSIEEYGARYKHFNRAQFSKQEHFLEALLQESGKRDINVVLVNMPLTTDNLNLMPAGFYSNYISAVRTLADKYGAPLLNLQEDRGYKSGSFYDTVHLNDVGGQRFLSALCNWIYGTAPAAPGEVTAADRVRQE